MECWGCSCRSLCRKWQDCLQCCLDCGVHDVLQKLSVRNSSCSLSTSSFSCSVHVAVPGGPGRPSRPSRPAGPATPSRPSRPGCPSLPSFPGSPGMQDTVVAGQVSAASVPRHTAVKQVTATRSLRVRHNIFKSTLLSNACIRSQLFPGACSLLLG